MMTPTSTDWLSVDDLTSPLQRMLGERVKVEGDWSVEQFPAGAREVLGVWRVSGTATTSDGVQPWSMILKGWPEQNQSGSPSSWDWPWREAELYQSGVLDNLPGISAPSCYGATERDNGIWLWLEDLSPHPQPEWTLERYPMLARRVGTLNGTCLASGSRPDHPALSRRWLAGWMSASNSVMAEFIEHPQHFWPLLPDVASTFVRLWHAREDIYASLASMPQTFCHLDAHALNAFFRPAGGEEEIVLIDWSFSGLAAPGEELSALVASSAIFVPNAFDIVDSIEMTAFGAYLEGLREAGWDGREEDVWRAYRSSTLLRYGPGTLRNLPPPDPPDEVREMLEANFGMPFESFAHAIETFTQWIADLALEGY